MSDVLLEDALSIIPPGIDVVIGAELEFYLREVSEGLICRLTSGLRGLCDVGKETGDKQYELRFAPTNDPRKLKRQIIQSKELVEHIAYTENTTAAFEAKPYCDQAGSAMHVHINFLDHKRNNLFARTQNEEASALRYAAGGLCKCLPGHMRYFAPNESSYMRFNAPGRETPTKICWGGNNRTAAIRIPDTNGNQHARRLEHRVPCADCNPGDAIGAVIAGALYGIYMKILPGEKIYGLSFDEHYLLPSLPLTFGEALSCDAIDILTEIKTEGILWPDVF